MSFQPPGYLGSAIWLNRIDQAMGEATMELAERAEVRGQVTSETLARRQSRPDEPCVKASRDTSEKICNYSIAFPLPPHYA